VADTRRRLLTGWGRTAASAAAVASVTDREQLPALLSTSPARGAIARGLGRSYGDAAQNAGGRVLDLTGLTRILHLDGERGIVHAEAGLSIDRLLRTLVPLGWFVPVTPGTRYVTLGGALAADIHGKNHHIDGSFAQHVTGFELVPPDGRRRRVTATSDPRLFWATAGGMGLTGAITSVELQLRPVSSSWMLVDTERARDLDDLLAALSRDDHRVPYSVAWFDGVASGGRLGRGVITRGRHAEAEHLPRHVDDPLRFAPSDRRSVPPIFPPGMLNRASVAAFNELWYRRAPRHRRDELQPLHTFFHPLDGVGGWNRIYGPHGFLQYQFVVPLVEVEALRRIVERISGSSLASFLAVLKRFGPGNEGLLSFPIEGWTLALDFPNVTGLRDLLDELDELVVAAGGRLYLAKDARMPPHVLRATYPRLDDFLAVRAELDPDRRLTSDLARRLDL
jgi:decaprenylphospho-beta-D-ribofuranose 2-oxidase